MRTREEINQDERESLAKFGIDSDNFLVNFQLETITEVLLDIRDILNNKTKE